MDHSSRTLARFGVSTKPGQLQSVPVEPPALDDLLVLPAAGSAEHRALLSAGYACIARNELAVVVLAGGMATRFGGGAKACAEALAGLSFLEVKVLDTKRAAQRAGGSIALYFMTSFATDGAVNSMLARANPPHVRVSTFAQFASLRLTPAGALFREPDGSPSLYATGHGDFGPALRRSGVLDTLRARGVKYIAMSNIDNLAATLDPALLGLHLQSGAQLSFEVVQSRPGDVGGVPARVGGRFEVIEGLRQPAVFDPSTIPLFSTNCFIFDAAALARDYPLEWFFVQKQVNGVPAVQFERLVNQLTAFLPSRGVVVPRDGQEGRFLPVKSRAELETARPMLARLLRQRGALAP